MARAEVSATRFTEALRKIGRPGGRQLDFLQAHESAPGRAMTAAKLALKAGYKSWAGVNVQYGVLAKRIGAALGKRNVNLFLLVEFVEPRAITNEHWILVMRPEFAQAMRQVGWTKGT